MKKLKQDFNDSLGKYISFLKKNKLYSEKRKFFYENKLDFYILGNISNTIIRDGKIYTPIINLHKLSDISEKKMQEGLELKVNAGVSVPKFSKYLVNKSTEYIIIRSPLVYGPGVKGNLKRLMEFIYKGFPF